MSPLLQLLRGLLVLLLLPTASLLAKMLFVGLMEPVDDGVNLSIILVKPVPVLPFDESECEQQQISLKIFHCSSISPFSELKLYSASVIFSSSALLSRTNMGLSWAIFLFWASWMFILLLSSQWSDQHSAPLMQCVMCTSPLSL